ncbi:hypothetical protein GALL_327800 [mine drainage metagenome]|uniref:Uncharacterized protein n=1 Tax=mine drainage metagenome TaxID=410659 RepID=A0A1J5QPT3_9ZZZZ
MHKSNLNTKHITKDQALLLGAFLIILFFTVLAAWFVITARSIRVFDIKKTQLILKNDGCNLLRMNGVDTKAAEFGNGCSVALPFLKNLYGNGGVITLEDKQIEVADDLILSTGTVEDLPWTPMKTEALILMMLSTVVLALMVRGFVFLLKKAYNK